MTKTCTKCGEVKPLEDFYEDRRSVAGGRYPRCKACTLVYQKQRNEADPTRKQKYNIKSKYGLEWDEYQTLLAQGCAVCGSMESLVIDHDHRCCPGKFTCGKCVSGVLCKNHNVAEGYIGTPENAESLWLYMLTKYADKEAKV